MGSIGFESRISDWVLMRWKGEPGLDWCFFFPVASILTTHTFLERDFVNCQAHESGLTIQGYYYCCLSRRDGTIDAFYHDISSTPYQKLSLSPLRSSTGGIAFASYGVL
jgi:hypothetical protein